MANLVGDHVGPGEIATRAELVAQVAEERQVEVDLPVARAVERPDRRARAAARRVDAVAEEHELGLLVGLPGALERLLPGLLGFGEDVRAEVAQVALGVLRRGDRRGLGRPRAFAERPGDVEAGRAG